MTAAPLNDVLSVPYGLRVSDNRLVPPGDASKTEIYNCPSCGAKLVVKQGEFRVWHFSHPPSAFGSEYSCSSETIQHQTAKTLLAQMFLDGLKIPIYLRCLASNDCHYLSPINFHCDEARLEFRLDSFRPDVLLFNQGKPVLALEVYHSHAVSELKSQNYPISYMEFAASQILSKPKSLLAISTNVERSTCSHHLAEAAERMAKAAKAAELMAEFQRRETQRLQDSPSSPLDRFDSTVSEWRKQCLKWEKPGELISAKFHGIPRVYGQLMEHYKCVTHSGGECVACGKYSCFFERPNSRDWSKKA